MIRKYRQVKKQFHIQIFFLPLSSPSHPSPPAYLHRSEHYLAYVLAPEEGNQIVS